MDQLSVDVSSQAKTDLGDQDLLGFSKVFDADLAGIRKKIQKLGLSEECVAEAVRWARSK